MELARTPDILKAAIEESYRLEARLCANPDFRRLEVVRRIITLYAPGAEVPARIDPISHPDPISYPEPAVSAIRAAPTTDPDPSPTNSSSREPDPSDPQPTSRQGLNTWGNSQSSRIRAAAAEHLMKTRKRATSGEICKAIVSKGIEVKGKKPAALVAAELSSSPIFDNTPDGYGLREWSNAGPPQNAPADAALRPDPRAGISRPTPSSDQPAIGSRPIAPSPDRTSGRGGWTWGNSKTSQIQAAAEDYLRATGRRARGGEIYRAIKSKIEINAKKPAALVSSRLTSSATFDRTREGYGLREWSGGAAPRKV